MEPLNCQLHFMSYIFDSQYPKWPIFIERTAIKSRIGMNLLRKVHGTVRKGVGL